MTRFNIQFSVKGISLLNSVMASSSSIQFKSFCSIKLTILLEMKCPQLSKPEATAARNQNSIGDRTEKKTLGETRLSRGAISPLARRHSSSIPTAARSDWRLIWFPRSCPDGCVMNLIIFTLFNLALLFKLYFSFREAYDFLLI